MRRRNPSHQAHVLLARHRVDHRPGAEEQQRLEEGVGVEVIDPRRIGRNAAREEHVAELGAGGVGDHPLDVVLAQPDRGGEERGGGSDNGDDRQGIGRVLHHRREPRDQEHARSDHGCGVDQRRDRCRALHGVRQPGVQAELGRLAHGADEQQKGQYRDGVGADAEKHQFGSRPVGDGLEYLVEHHGIEQQVGTEDAERKPEVADTVDQERLDGGGVGGRAVVPEPDQQVRGKPHTPSQPKNIWTRLSAVTSISIEKVNSDR